MASYAASVDMTESGQGCKVSVLAGPGGVTAGKAVKLSGGRAVVCTAKTDVFYGVAAITAAENTPTLVLRTGCLVKTGETLTADGYVQPKDGGTGEFEDYTDGTIAGIVTSSATSASIIRLL